MISVVIPVYNAAETLPATLSSIRGQLWTDWEVILVDDGSTDGSCLLAKRFAAQDDRIRAVSNPGKGPSAARNHGALECAKGKIIAFCDADDLWEPEKLLDVYFGLPDDADALFGAVLFFADDPETCRSRSTVPEGDVTIPMLLGENPVCTMSNLSIRRDVFEAIGGLDEGLVHNEDLDLLIRLVGSGYRLRGEDQDHVRYRLSTGGLSANLDAMRAGREAALKSARRFGFEPDPQAEAIHQRYLARRALRIGATARTVRTLVMGGLGQHAGAFLSPMRRGVPLTLAALCLPALPHAWRRRLFAR